MREAAELWAIAIGDIEDDLRSRHVELGGRLVESPGMIGLLNSPIPYPCYVHADEADLRNVLPRLLNSRPVPRVHLISSHPDRDLLEESGWQVQQEVTQMVLPRSAASSTCPSIDGVTFEELEIPEGIASFYAGMTAGFGDALGDAEEELPREVIATQGIHLFVARDDADQVIGTAGARRRSGGANLFAISVVPGHRDRGIGSALTALASLAMFETGACSIQLYATEEGHRVYERAGFGVAGHWAFYRPTSQPR